MKQALSVSWIPLALAFTIQVTFLRNETDFDLILFLGCLVLSTGHFYIGGFFARNYLSKEPKSLSGFWLILAMSYVPFILSCWGAFWLHDPIESNMLFSGVEYIVLGMLASLILFVMLSVKKVGYDLDAVLAVLAIAMMTSAIWDFAIGFLMIKLYP